MPGPAEGLVSPYAELSAEQRDQVLRKIISASLGVAGLGQDAFLSYQLLEVVPQIAQDPAPDLTRVWTCLGQSKATSERIGRLLLAVQLQLQRNYVVSPLMPPQAESAVREALQRAGSADALWLQINAALVRALSTGAGVDRAEADAGTADSIATRRKKEEERARRRAEFEKRKPPGAKKKKKGGPVLDLKRLPGGLTTLVVLGVVVVVWLCFMINWIVHF